MQKTNLFTPFFKTTTKINPLKSWILILFLLPASAYGQETHPLKVHSIQDPFFNRFVLGNEVFYLIPNDPALEGP